MFPPGQCGLPVQLPLQAASGGGRVGRSLLRKVHHTAPLFGTAGDQLTLARFFLVRDPITGKVKQTYTIIGGRDIDQGLNALREVWNTPELQRLEEKVDALVCHYHPTLYAKYQNSAYSKVTSRPNHQSTHGTQHMNAILKLDTPLHQRWNAVLIRRGDRRRRRHKQRRRIPHDDADGTNSRTWLHVTYTMCLPHILNG